MKRNYIVENVELEKKKVNRKPLVCDACNEVFKGSETVKVNVVVLNGYIWGIVCDKSCNLLKKEIKNVYDTNSCEAEIPEVQKAVNTLYEWAYF
jgi:hypothetical protein